MGCHCSQAFLSQDEEEEFLMQDCESALGFPSHSSAKLCTQILVLTVNNRLNWNRLKRLSENLQLPLQSEGAKIDPIANFYQSIKDGDWWEARKLGVVAMLLGKGSCQNKAELLFTFYDQEYNKYLTKEEVESLVIDLCEMALVTLPACCVEYLEHINNLDAAVLIQNYASKLCEARPEAINQITSLILSGPEEQITLLTFKEKVDSLNFLFSATNLRRHTIAKYKQMLRDQAKHRSKATKGVST